MNLVVSKINVEAENIKSLRLKNPNNEDLPEFSAGSHIEIELTLENGEEIKRNYSLTNDSKMRKSYEIAVLREEYSRGGSHFLHEKVAVGDSLKVSDPRNEFLLEENSKHNVLIAGGIGITPILAMTRKLVREKKSFELHYAARAPAKMAFADEIKRIAERRSKFYFSHTKNPQLINLEKLLASPNDETHIYVCGPRSLISAVRKTAAKSGWKINQIHFESFGAKRNSSDKTFEVELKLSEMTVKVPPEKTILDAMLEAGAWAVYDCKRGECGMCLAQVLEGEPDHRDVCLTEEQRQNSMTTCVSRAKTDKLVLEI